MTRREAILRGAGRLFDFRGCAAEAKRRDLETLRRSFAGRSDAQALASDWAKVGSDIRTAAGRYAASRE